MDSKELMMMMMIKMENNTTFDPFSSLGAVTTNSNSNIVDTSAGFDDGYKLQADQKSPSSLGFMDLLGFQDFYSSNNSLFDNHHQNQQLPLSQPPMEMDVATSSAHYDHEHDHNQKAEEEVLTVDDGDDDEEETSSVVLNGQQPSSPNSCSVSSPAHQQLHKPPIKQCMKGKKTAAAVLDGDETKPKSKKKKEREARFAFMTRSEIDHLDDGYRWRKYGQKAVKNSHFPRSYYRCTSASCNVKKRVERCMGDPSYVVTTYEGQHVHPASAGAHTSTTYSFDHLINPAIPTTVTNATKYATPHAMMKLDQGAGLLQDMLHFPH